MSTLLLLHWLRLPRSMDCSDLAMGGGQASRRELLGPRPTPLRMRKDSYRLKKPPVAPPQHRPPIIIYAISPKVIHTTPGDFMSVVQRLTGAAAASSSSSSADAPLATGEVFSPAARLAVFEKAAKGAISDDLLGTGGGQTQISYVNELSAAIYGSRSFPEMINSFTPSPSNFLSGGMVPSPAAFWDLFNQYQDP
ncbi:VQ motif [Musa troglodytarum]|uniref:VQ motif n=2 Tax=Musa troglodytarum TaxID=320322 RepID=A0A9E7IJY8_9LILI|nr:VQ motif [Musa troglodytarum]